MRVTVDIQMTSKKNSYIAHTSSFKTIFFPNRFFPLFFVKFLKNETKKKITPHPYKTIVLLWWERHQKNVSKKMFLVYLTGTPTKEEEIIPYLDCLTILKDKREWTPLPMSVEPFPEKVISHSIAIVVYYRQNVLIYLITYKLYQSAT